MRALRSALSRPGARPLELAPSPSPSPLPRPCPRTDLARTLALSDHRLASCPGGTTQAPGAKTAADCGCKPGLFLQGDGTCADGQTTFRDAGVPVDAIDFTQPGVTIETLPLKVSYWRVNNATLNVGRCYSEGACLGARPGGASSSLHSVKVSFTVSGTISDYATGTANSNMIKSGLAKSASVAASAVTLTVTAASVKIDASIAVADAAYPMRASNPGSAACQRALSAALHMRMRADASRIEPCCGQGRRIRRGERLG